jgi:hypothetical protein
MTHISQARVLSTRRVVQKISKSDRKGERTISNHDEGPARALSRSDSLSSIASISLIALVALV